MLEPHCRCLNVAIIVLLRIEDEHIKLLVVDQSEFRWSIHASDSDLLSSLRNVRLQVVIVQALASQSELREVALANLLNMQRGEIIVRFTEDYDRLEYLP